MAWSMPPTGSWGPGMGGSPNVNMGNYTPEQWAAMQQQNWQQWTQWHQQYATWHSQFGNQYSEQYQAMQMCGMPPLPPISAAPPPGPPPRPPPAPPPPDKPPPPPPPHENNQPLYVQSQQQATTGMASAQNTPLNNGSEMTGNIQNRTFATDIALENSVNSEALRTLAEEQKAFDIQFQQWEEEFEKWKKANINHPDKKAYREYELTFETCKARLLERRLQMKQKKARLLNNDNMALVAPPRHNVLPAGPPPSHSAGAGDYHNNEQTGYPLQNYNNFQNNQHSKMPQHHYYRDTNINTSFEPQNRQDSYNNSNTSNIPVTPNMSSTEHFLPTIDPPTGIPGLDLVPETEKHAIISNDVIEIIDDPVEKQFRPDQQPDYSKISKGINNILGDEKIMNILSMMRGQGPQPNNAPHHLLPNPSRCLLPNPPNNNQGPYGSLGPVEDSPMYMGMNDVYNDNNYGMAQNVPHMNQYKEYDMQKEINQGKQFAAGPPKLYSNRSDNSQQNHYNERNQLCNNQSLLPLPGMQQNVRPNAQLRSLLDPIQSQKDYVSEECQPRHMQEEMYPGRNVGITQNIVAGSPQIPMNTPVWGEQPLFAPSIIVDYDHKPLRLKAREFFEPVHTFDYNHKSKDDNVKKRNFEKEAEELFTRNPRPEREARYAFDKHSKDLYYRKYDRTSSRETRDYREERDYRGTEFDERRRFVEDVKDRRVDYRRRDDRDKFYRREEMHRDRDREEMYRERDRGSERIRSREREIRRSRERDRGSDYSRDRETNRERNREFRRSRSREKDYQRKRALSRESDHSTSSKKSKDTPAVNEKPSYLVMIDDILEVPGRQMRPDKIVIILRGPPGSGKSYLAKLIRDREAEHGGTVRVMSIDDYFMQEGETEEKDSTGKIVKKPSLRYEYDEKLEETYMLSLKRAFKRSVTDGYFSFLIYDAVNEHLRNYADIWNFARQNGFQVYICTMDMDPHTCFKRNIHNRTLEEIEVICTRFYPTPVHHIQMDATTLLQSASIADVHMEDADGVVKVEAPEDSEVNSSFTSKWEKMDDAVQLARLDGTSRPPRAAQPSMEDYLQLDDWTPAASKPGKKTVRWADIEERRQQEKMRAIGFVVGQTDWTRMTDPTMGSAALTQTKYIKRVRRP